MLSALLLLAGVVVLVLHRDEILGGGARPAPTGSVSPEPFVAPPVDASRAAAVVDDPITDASTADLDASAAKDAAPAKKDGGARAAGAKGDGGVKKPKPKPPASAAAPGGNAP